MSFSKEVKTEIANSKISKNERDVKLEALGYILSNQIDLKSNLHFSSENKEVIIRYIYIFKNVLGFVIVEDDAINSKNNVNVQYMLDIINIEDYNEKMADLYKQYYNINIQQDSIAFLKGAFLSSGYVLNPKDSYHLEFVVSCLEIAETIKRLLLSLGINCNIANRKKQTIVYIKDGDNICELLILLGANVGVVKFEEQRVEKEMNNNMNRAINCETGNLNKTINASNIQIEDIIFLKKNNLFDLLSTKLQEIANLRVENPEYTLIDIANQLGISKSGANNRFKKIHKIVQDEKEKYNEGV